MAWSKNIVSWYENGYLCLSVPFTWLLPKARGIALSHPNERIAIGGPAVKILPEYASTFAEIEPFQPKGVLQRHNHEATRTSIGCPNGCWFCYVRTISGEFHTFDEWPLGRIICDDNFLAGGYAHVKSACSKLKGIEKLDFQGIDPALLTHETAKLIAELNPKAIHIGWDSESETDCVWDAISTWKAAGGKKDVLRIYVLINAGETPTQAEERMMRLQKENILGTAMRYQKPTLKKNEYLSSKWTEHEIRRFCRYWNKSTFFRGVKYSEYAGNSYIPPPKSQLKLIL